MPSEVPMGTGSRAARLRRGIWCLREVCSEGASQRVSWERGGVSTRESSGKEAIRRGSDRRHKGAHGTVCHFVRLGCRMV